MTPGVNIPVQKNLLALSSHLLTVGLCAFSHPAGIVAPADGISQRFLTEFGKRVLKILHSPQKLAAQHMAIAAAHDPAVGRLF
ncbi:hypothetical protein [Ferribacterium limneticum]|uniref:hypothetical protein n=1 Tax=Ferribacterium limneticum TaxID=76259 RepID=UPI001CFC2ED5|nr:hypothetical protein [Ferribacterium limneticum]UCV17834.1 hypothetical protein KI610_13525 [Ferribacterium limneticum]